VEIGELMLQRTAYARKVLAAVDGVEPIHDQPVIREFAVRVDAPVAEVIERCADEGVNPGYRLGADYEEHEDGLLVAITEQRTREDIDRLAEVLGRAVAGARRARRPEEVTA
jgi:glycine dehydrogenase subunit 1